MRKGHSHKAILALFFSLVAATAQAQTSSKPPKLPIDEQTKLVTYKEVVDIPASGFKELQKRAFIWANAYYKNPVDVIRERDTVAGKMICKARLKILNEPDKKGVVSEAGLIEYTLKLEFKENKYRYTITEINWKQRSYFPVERWMDTSLPGYKADYVYYLQQTDDLMKGLVKDLVKAMQQPAPRAKKDDW